MLIGVHIGHDIFETDSVILSLIKIEHIVLAFTLLLILSRKINIKRYINFGTSCAFCLYIWTSGVALLWFYKIAIVEELFSYYYSYTTTTIATSFVFLMIGLNIHLLNDSLQIKKTRVIFYAVVTIYFAMIIYFAFSNPLAGINLWYLVGINRSGSEDFFCYLAISDSCALLLLLVISRIRNLNIKLLVMIIGVFMLFITTSRTSLISYVFAVSIAYMIHFVKRGFLKNAVIFVIISLLFYIFAIYNPSLIPQSVLPESHRFYIDFENIKYIRGYEQRMHWLEVGLLELEEHWLLGQYMPDVVRGLPGSYIHNWLSFWSSFGLCPFLLSIIIMIIVLYKTTVLFIHDTSSPIKEFLFTCSILMIMTVIVGRGYGYVYIWLILSTFPMIHDRVSNQSGSIRKKLIDIPSTHPMSNERTSLNNLEVKNRKLTPN
jgi:hypothetical protein